MRCFLTGTGTDVGKTIISAWLCAHFQAAYWKPIQCGLDAGGRTDGMHVRELTQSEILPEAYTLAAPRSPHHAAALEGIRIDLDRIALPNAPRLIVEGAGGALVPLTSDGVLQIDLMVKLALPVIIVASGKLGTINHTLLTIEALRARRLSLLGVVLNGSDLEENGPAIENFGRTKILARFPTLERPDRTALLAFPLPELLVKKAKVA